MGKSWGGRGDSLDYVTHPYKRDNSWKLNLHMEEDTVSEPLNVFVIINEWEDANYGDATFEEIVGAKFFLTEDAAWDALYQIAESYDVDLLKADAAFDLPDVRSIRNQTYYIQELTRG